MCSHRWCHERLPLSAPSSIPKVCAVCHEGGHWASECPTISHAGMVQQPFHNKSNMPPDPCWACTGEYHSAHCCEKSQPSSAASLCILCGAAGHYYKKCAKYDPEIHKPRNNRPAGRTAGLAAPTTMWCPRHGSAAHATSTCDSKSAPILMSVDDIKAQHENIFLWCNLPGHSMTQCMQRAPMLALEKVRKSRALEKR